MQGISGFISQNYTLIVVGLGTAILSMAAGVVGTFSYLRKRALIGDVISHAVLPGVAIAFMLSGVKNSLYFALGATASGMLSVWLVDLIQRKSKLKPDTILALILSVFFGVGIVLLTHIQHSGNAAQSGLDHFLFGKAASLNLQDVKLFSVVSLLNVGLLILFLRGLKVLSFDEMYARSIGIPVGWLKNLLAILTVITVASGVQAVGVVLMAALLITPATGARFLTHRVKWMLLFSAIFGGLAGLLGAVWSASGSGMPTGPLVVVVLTAIAMVAILFGREKGVVKRLKQRRENQIKINTENVLKQLYHLSEQGTKKHCHTSGKE